MNVYKIPAALAPQYKGAGQALAAIAGDKLVGLVYLEDAIPGFDGDAAEALNDDRIGPTVRELSALGEVIAGMCSAWEFVEL
ncbi:hypothetical protein [Polaromonas jejuensis]|uniref:Uncharacterized protein n=1 Tax=Polaromonas jejuensis TaxID=457502 RepID=A0ABW0QG69_9BURK|nr:hypothetical protein [Polaromonas jejuensis]